MSTSISPNQDRHGRADNDPPGLSALFLIKFDVKVGYTIAWKRSEDDVELDGVVEYKSLPSGLHNVKEDLVYFTHQTYAGLSAFANGSAGANERNARFVAVGVLVPRKDGRLGRSWLHAQQLKELAHELVQDVEQTQSLERYWEKHRIAKDTDEARNGVVDSPFTSAQRRARTLSTATSMSSSEDTLPVYHPALSILDYVDTFGPLIFTLQREALLRKRMLLVSRPPMHTSCNFVYDLSILSSLPLSLAPILSLPTSSIARIRPLFNLGIHDIPYLEKLAAQQQSDHHTPQPKTPTSHSTNEDNDEVGWIACTSDEILTVKSKLFDVLVEMPSASSKRWPILKRMRDGSEIKATQRDLRRYKSLRRALYPVSHLIKTYSACSCHSPSRGSQSSNDEAEDHVCLLSSPSKVHYGSGKEDWAPSEQDQLAEATSWSELAYSSFIWWASAGEREEAELEEDEMDREALGDLHDVAARLAEESGYHDAPDDDDDENADSARRDSNSRNQDLETHRTVLQTALIAYFHRLTRQLFEAACSIIPSHEPRDQQDNDENDSVSDSSIGDNDPGQTIQLHSAELRRLGLDVWSTSTVEFVSEFADLWFDKNVECHRMGVECCGIRIC